MAPIRLVPGVIEIAYLDPGGGRIVLALLLCSALRLVGGWRLRG